MSTEKTTISALSSLDPSIQAMLISATPRVITELADCGNYRPTLCLPVDLLDEIIEGKADTKSLEDDFLSGCYLHEILPSLDWWMDISNTISHGRFDRSTNVQTVFDKHKDRLIELLNDALCQYTSALAESNNFRDRDSDEAPASIELLKRYRLYTRAVCAFAKEVWPEVEFGWLLKQA